MVRARQPAHQGGGFDAGAAAYGNTMDGVLAREVRRQQLAVFYRQGPMLSLINLLIAVLVAVVDLVYVPTAILAGWFIAVVVMSIYPIRGWLIARRNPRGSAGSESALRRVTVQSLVAGLIWASAAPLFFPHLQAEQQIFIALILAGMASSSLVVLAAIPSAAAAYALPPALPIVYLFVTSDSLAFIAVGVMITAYFATAVFASRSSISGLVGSFRARLVDVVANDLQEQRFRDFATAGADWLWETDINGNFVFLTADSASRPRLQPISDLMRRPTGIDPVHVVDQENHLEAVAAVQQRLPFRDLMYAVSTRRGRTHYLRVSGQPRFTEDGHFAGYRGTAAGVDAPAAQAA